MDVRAAYSELKMAPDVQITQKWRTQKASKRSEFFGYHGPHPVLSSLYGTWAFLRVDGVNGCVWRVLTVTVFWVYCPALYVYRGPHANMVRCDISLLEFSVRQVSANQFKLKLFECTTLLMHDLFYCFIRTFLVNCPAHVINGTFGGDCHTSWR